MDSYTDLPGMQAMTNLLSCNGILDCKLSSKDPVLKIRHDVGCHRCQLLPSLPSHALQRGQVLSGLQRQTEHQHMSIKESGHANGTPVIPGRRFG